MRSALPETRYARAGGTHIAYQVLGDEVLVSSTVKDLVAGSGIAFDDRGSHILKGIPDAWRVYAVQR